MKKASAQMSLKEILLLIAAIAITLAIPIALVWSMVDHIRNGKKRDRRGGGGGNALAGAMQELDRLVTRPSVEHVIEAQNPTLRREDDEGGD
jgi:hypothetical protein